jgi:predicted DNA-binding protein (MmcQ/YjbR family)
MFSDGDLGLAELRKIALGFPGAFEKISHGRPAFCVPKMFAMYGGSSKTAVPGEMTRFSHSLLVKVEESERTALLADARFFFPAYLGPAGWLGLDFTAATIDWAEVTELVDASYRLVAPRKLLNQLDDTTHGAP